MRRKIPGNLIRSSVLSCFIAAACNPGQPPAGRAPAPVPVSTPNRDYDQLLRAAQSYLERGDAEKGAEIAGRAIAARPAAPRAHLLLGRALAMSGKLEASATAYEKARELGSKDRRLYTELASVYDVSQRYDEAVAVYREFLAANPTDTEMHHELGLTLVLQGRPEDGVENLRTAHRLAPDEPQVHLDYGFGLLQAKRLDEAAEVLQALLDAHPDNTLASQFLAQVRAGQGRNAEALTLLDRAIAAGRNDPRPVRLRAQLRVVMGDHEAALGDYQMLVKADPADAGALVGAAGALIALDRLAEAQTAVERLQSMVGDSPQVAFRAAQIAWRRGEESAVATLEQFAARHPGVLEAWRELLVAATATGDAELEERARAKVLELREK